MPRPAESSEIDRVFPWSEWATQLSDSPTGALVFDRSDFGEMSPASFRGRAMRAFSDLDVRSTIRGEEVVVTLNA